MPVPEIPAVNIRPGVSVLSVLKHLNYKPWYALGEFVDNAVQSALENFDALNQLHGNAYKLRVEIELDSSDGGRIVVRDNAAGIRIADYDRAFKAAEVPPNRQGLSEFGMGMKSAGFWFSPEWSVRTKALGETVEGTIHFRLDEILSESREAIPVSPREAPVESHYTEITLSAPHKMPAGRTLAKIKDHLTGMYRQFLRSGRLELLFRGEQLTFDEPKVLAAPFYKRPSGAPVEWRKDIQIDLGGGLIIRGFAAIRERASTSEAGFALMRRDRLILGSGDEGYRPEQIFGRSNSYRYQRLFGELQLEGFKVSHTKDGFQWEEREEEFLSQLREQLESDPLPLLEQAEQYRVRMRAEDVRRGAEAAVASTADVLARNAAPVIETQRAAPLVTSPPPEELIPPRAMAARRELTLKFRNEQWIVAIELADDPAIGDWLTVGQIDRKGDARRIAIRVSLAHPFMERFAGVEAEQLEPLLRLASAFALAQVVARDSGVRQVGTVLRHVNELLRLALSNS